MATNSGNPVSKRLFVAITLPEEMRRRLLELEVPHSLGVRHSLDKLHLTLAFVGSIPANVQKTLQERLALLVHAPFTLSVAGVGRFGHTCPRALWAAVSGDLDALTNLRNVVQDVLRDTGLPPDQQEFVPHVTLVYCRQPVYVEEADAFLARYHTFDGGTFPVMGFTLYSSANGRYSPELIVRWPV